MCKDKKRDDFMATSIVNVEHTITEKQALEIINAPVYEVKSTNITKQLHESKSLRMEKAYEILSSIK